MNINKIIDLVDAYIIRHGLTAQYISRRPDDNVYIVRTTDYTVLEGRVIECKSGAKRVQFKVDGKRESIYK